MVIWLVLMICMVVSGYFLGNYSMIYMFVSSIVYIIYFLELLLQPFGGTYGNFEDLRLSSVFFV